MGLQPRPGSSSFHFSTRDMHRQSGLEGKTLSSPSCVSPSHLPVCLRWTILGVQWKFVEWIMNGLYTTRSSEGAVSSYFSWLCFAKFCRLIWNHFFQPNFDIQYYYLLILTCFDILYYSFSTLILSSKSCKHLCYRL